MAGLTDVDQDARACAAWIYATDFDAELVCVRVVFAAGQEVASLDEGRDRGGVEWRGGGRRSFLTQRGA